MKGGLIHTAFHIAWRGCVVWLLLIAPLFADTPEQTYDKQIKPLFAAKCFDCHSTKADELKGGLKLDTLDDVLRGGASGKTVLPGDVENSFLLSATGAAIAPAASAASSVATWRRPGTGITPSDRPSLR